MNLTYLTRHKDLIPIEACNKKICIVGAGAIGSHVSMALARMGFLNLILIDFDEVEEFNMNSQGYMPEDIGRMKVEAMAKKIYDFSGVQIERSTKPYTKETLDCDIIIAAVDSMEVRKSLWENNRHVPLYIDSRMGAEVALLLTSTPFESDYANSLYSDKDAVQEKCTAKATIYTAMLVSGLVCKIVKDFALNKPYTKTVTWDIASNSYQSFLVNKQ